MESFEEHETKPSAGDVERDWEKDFFARFGANKIWVRPSRDNVETILDIHQFISQEILLAKEQGKREMRDRVVGIIKSKKPRPADKNEYMKIAKLLDGGERLTLTTNAVISAFDDLLTHLQNEETEKV